MDVFEAIDGRVTARKLGEPGPGTEQLTRILQAGVRAPDHGRLSPWRFVVLQGETRAVLGDAMAALRRRSDPACSDEAAGVERDKAFRAPVVVVVAAEVTPSPKVPAIEQVMAVAACVQNMTLAARALGFVANWKTGAAAYDAGVKQALGLDAEASVVAILYIGTQASDAQEPRQASLDRVLRVL